MDWMKSLEKQERSEHEAVQGFADLVEFNGLERALMKVLDELADRRIERYAKARASSQDTLDFL
jgi:hypothetical protein